MPSVSRRSTGEVTSVISDTRKGLYPASLATQQMIQMMEMAIHGQQYARRRLKRLIEGSIKKLPTFYSHIERADIYLKTGDTSMPDAKIVEIRLAVPRRDLFATASAASFEGALAKVTDKLRRQLKRHKAKLNAR